ncbi:MAG: hypothetical protein HZB37_09160 [Planctomycetes bacterium]|nr:hypothetical protein [Planctomycetota bacterium]
MRLLKIILKTGFRVAQLDCIGVFILCRAETFHGLHKKPRLQNEVPLRSTGERGHQCQFFESKNKWLGVGGGLSSNGNDGNKPRLWSLFENVVERSAVGGNCEVCAHFAMVPVIYGVALFVIRFRLHGGCGMRIKRGAAPPRPMDFIVSPYSVNI